MFSRISNLQESCQLSDLLATEDVPAEEQYAQQRKRSLIEDVLRTLSYREREIIRLRYGFTDGYCYTLEEVRHMFQLTRERIRQIEGKALRKLRDHVRATKLEAAI